MPVICTALGIIALSLVIYWFRYHSGAFATPEQSEYFDSVDKDLEKKGL